MSSKILETINKYEMLKKGDTVVIGLSGGADSVCLTHFLYSIKEEYNLTLILAHVNHGIRGEEALRDENFCRVFAKKLNIQFELLNADIPAEAKKTGESEEECGRRMRYEFFSLLAGKKAKIATAHNLNDSAETVMLNIVRGTGIKGLCGIPPIRENIIRPLILTSRSDIENYCKIHSLRFVTDSTNMQNGYKRNKIRNIIFPELQKINPSLLSAFSRLIENSADDEAVLEDIAQSQYENCRAKNGFDEKALSELPSAIKRRVIYKALAAVSSKDVNSVHVSDVENIIGTGKILVTSGGITVKSHNGALTVKKDLINYATFSVPLDISKGLCKYPHGCVKIQTLHQKDLQNFNKELLDNAIDCDKIVNNPILRSRHAGDSFKSARRHNTKSLKKLFNEAKIVPEKRNAVPVLSCGGEIVWIDTFGVSENFKADKSSDKIIIIENVSGVNYYES